jgi:hypothetical protein
MDNVWLYELAIHLPRLKLVRIFEGLSADTDGLNYPSVKWNPSEQPSIAKAFLGRGIELDVNIRGPKNYTNKPREGCS